ncbi:MAG: KH domain-containing protein [Theionarchaea archaeon]|nr:KH domain-containing protein [Theionarchaea archaeon]MBU6999664.1 KH domain-containing protein [Theionarchaea archaeon]MBU7020670.1 KH domain-containing protein [Theionarchaea archaeon]MBU7035048.1 KH domain-containing protein [Theionarchaea archaeon]MBU7039844.1 KH domain-containing protein [Theionarchaea archaeon]
MKAPICEICLKSGILCLGCEEKLKKGVITDLDVKISKLLYQLEQEHHIRDISFVKAVESRSIIVIIVGKGEIGNLIGKGGKTVKFLQRSLRKKIRIIEDTDDVKKIIQDLLHPARVLGMNILYFPSGEKKYKVRVPREDERRIPTTLQSAEEILSKLTDLNIQMTLE